MAHEDREVTDVRQLVTPHLQGRAKSMKVPMLPFALIKLLPVLHNLIPHLGNGASPSGLGLPTSINSQDNPSQTCMQANPV